MKPIDFYNADGWGDREYSGLLNRQRKAMALVVAAVGGHGQPPTIVDVGCGDGSFLAELSAAVTRPDASYVGIDYSTYQLAKAARLPFTFKQADLGQGIPLADESADVIHAAEVIEHLYDPDLLIEECARVLRPGGHLILTTPNLQAWYNRVLFLVGIQPLFLETSSRSTTVGAGALRRLKRDTRPVGHLRLFNRTALTDLLRREGFTPRQVAGARYHDVPPGLRWLDAAFCVRPSLASIFVVDAKKV